MATNPNPNREWLNRVEALRGEAWAALTKEAAFAPVKAFDEAVVAVGGMSILPAPALKTSTLDAVIAAKNGITNYIDRVKRVSQGDAAEAILRELGEPASVSDILSLLPEKGVRVGGEKPLINFTSTLSKDERFESVRSGGNYFWWFKGEALPPGWNESTGPSLLDEPADPSVSSNQEGGDGHDPATT